MARIIGIDEAGYGPNLGPLVVVASVWETDQNPATCDFDRAFGTSSPLAGRLPIADSKRIYVSGGSYAGLERAALTLLMTDCRGTSTALPKSFHALLARVSEASLFELTAPWYAETLRLPLEVEEQEIRELSMLWKQQEAREKLRLLSVHADVVSAERFNRMLDREGGKGLAHTRNCFRLLQTVWQPAETVTRVYVDKHGGRNRYLDFLTEIAGGTMIFTAEEGSRRSHYRIGQSEMLIEPRAESHFPVAVASMVAKYLREIVMLQFNQYWRRHRPDIKSTKGYPVDAKRYFAEIEPLLTSLGLSKSQVWRNR